MAEWREMLGEMLKGAPLRVRVAFGIVALFFLSCLVLLGLLFWSLGGWVALVSTVGIVVVIWAYFTVVTWEEK